MPEAVAIGFVHSQFHSRRNGGNGFRLSTYNRSAEGWCERIGQGFDYTHRPPPEHSEMRVPLWAVDPQRRAAGEPDPEIPESVRKACADPAKFWNSVEFFEKRKDAQVARQLIVALPGSPLITPDDRIRLARLFADRFVADGFVVQLDIHVPDRVGEADEGVNWHAHLLMPTRRLCCEGLNPLKARDSHPVYRRTKAGGKVVECDYLGEEWRKVQDEYFRNQGLDIRVDPNGAICQVHLGPVRLRKGGAHTLAHAETVRLAARQAAQQPDMVAEVLTRGAATFSEADVGRFLKKQLGSTLDSVAIEHLQREVLAHADTWPLLDPRTGEATGRYTTRRVREQEEATATAAARLAGRAGFRVSAGIARSIERSLSLNPEQLEAFRYAIGRSRDEEELVARSDLKFIRGRAGTGKSFTLKAIRRAYQASGKSVIYMGPTHSVIQDMGSEGFDRVQTVQSALWQANRYGPSWTPNTVLVVDEAAMLSADMTGELLQRAEATGAKLILVGDERQLGSIKRGGLFGQLAMRHRSRVLTKVLRQTETWQQQASRDLAEYRFQDALQAFDIHGAIRWRNTRDEAVSALIEAWTRDHADNPAERRFVFAYENRYVNQINDELHQVRRAKGELFGPDVQLTVRRGSVKEGEQVRSAKFAVGDRIQFTATRKASGIYNGASAIIRVIDRSSGEIHAQLDTASGPGRLIKWNAKDFNGFDLGYAGTIYKGQGKTFAQTYLLHTERWQAGPSYVALTRQRKEAKLFVGRDTAVDVEQLARQMSREGAREASIAWAADRRVVNGEVKVEGAGGRVVPPAPAAKVRASAAKPDLASISAADQPETSGAPSSAETVSGRPVQARGGRVSPRTRAQMEATLAKWLAGGGDLAAGTKAKLSSKDAEALRQLLDSLDERAKSARPADPKAQAAADAGEPVDEARTLLDRERRRGRSSEVR